MKTIDRLLAVDSSSADWAEAVPEFQIQIVTLMRLIRVASQSITAYSDPVLRTAGLTESSYHTLILVMASGTQGTTPTALCEQVGQNRANMTRILEVLVSEKLVQIETDARDARRRRVVVLPAGRKLVRTYARLFEPIVTVAFSGLSADDQQTFERLLRAVIQSMGTAERTVSRTV